MTHSYETRKRVYFYSPSNSRPIALIAVYLVEGKLPPVLEWRGVIFYWHEQVGGYRQWMRKNDVARVVDNDVEQCFGVSVG